MSDIQYAVTIRPVTPAAEPPGRKQVDWDARVTGLLFVAKVLVALVIGYAIASMTVLAEEPLTTVSCEDTDIECLLSEN